MFIQRSRPDKLLVQKKTCPNPRNFLAMPVGTRQSLFFTQCNRFVFCAADKVTRRKCINERDVAATLTLFANVTAMSFRPSFDGSLCSFRQTCEYRGLNTHYHTKGEIP